MSLTSTSPLCGHLSSPSHASRSRRASGIGDAEKVAKDQRQTDQVTERHRYEADCCPAASWMIENNPVGTIGDQRGIRGAKNRVLSTWRGALPVISSAMCRKHLNWTSWSIFPAQITAVEKKVWATDGRSWLALTESIGSHAVFMRMACSSFSLRF